MNHIKNMIVALVNGDEEAAARHFKAQITGKTKRMFESDDGFDEALEAWQGEVKKAYPEVASKIKFKAADGGKTISAEVPGEDRCYGVFDLDSGTGEVLSEGVAITADNIQLLGKKASERGSTLRATAEFEKISGLDQAYAEKLATAWEGDLEELKKKGAGFESLVPKMLDPNVVKRLSKLDVDSVKADLDKIAALHAAAFSSGATLKNYQKKIGSDIWAHVRPVKECLEDYLRLKEEVEAILEEISK